MENFSLLYDGLYTPVRYKNYRYMKDLNVDDIVSRLSRGKQEFELDKLYKERLNNLDHIYYRQQIFRDIEDEDVYNGFSAFSTDIVNLGKAKDSTTRVYDENQRNWYKMNEVSLYVKLSEKLNDIFNNSPIASKGLLKYKKLINEYIASPGFQEMKSRLNEIYDELSQIHYTVRIRGNVLEVFNKQPKDDYSDVIAETFKRFKQYDTESYLYHGFQLSIKLNEAEEKVMEGVTAFYKKTFDKLKLYANKYNSYESEVILDFYKEIQFYLSYADYIRMFKKKGISFCYPEFTDEKIIEIENGINAAVARNNDVVVTNNFEKDYSEDVFVITGANQGGKTTYARMIGQIIHFAQLGVPVPATYVRIFMCTEILAHFEVDEDVATENGKLKEDLVRVKELLDDSDDKSIFIFNEVFSSTTMEDARKLGVNVIRMIQKKGAICVYVTFLDKIIADVPGCVSYVSVVTENGERIFKIVRREADGKSYAMMLAEKYNLLYEQIVRRVVG